MARTKERKIDEWRAKQEIEDYIREHPKAQLFDISIGLNLPVEQVEGLLKLTKGGA